LPSIGVRISNGGGGGGCASGIMISSSLTIATFCVGLWISRFPEHFCLFGQAWRKAGSCDSRTLGRRPALVRRFTAKSAAWLSQISGRFWQVLDTLVSRRTGLLEIAPDCAV
jgi:hypothetical protein